MTSEQLAELLRAAGKYCPHGMFTDPEGLAFLLGTTERTLSNWRAAGQGPVWVKLGRIRYDLADVAAWWAENKA